MTALVEDGVEQRVPKLAFGLGFTRQGNGFVVANVRRGDNLKRRSALQVPDHEGLDIVCESPVVGLRFSFRGLNNVRIESKCQGLAHRTIHSQPCCYCIYIGCTLQAADFLPKAAPGCGLRLTAGLIFSRLMTELSLENIALERGERRIADGINARVAAGQALLLQGPNGSGKSTLLRVLAGLLPAAEGAILWDGIDVARDREAHRARLCYLGHQDALKASLTALENLQFWASFNGGSAETALKAFDLARLADRPARMLSAGQKRRLALSRLALNDAPLWLLDEPVTALDAEAREAFIALLQQHLAAGGLAIIATHEALAIEAHVLQLGAAA